MSDKEPYKARRANRSARQNRAEQRALTRRSELEARLRQAEQEASSWGELIRAIRENRGWSRSMLIANYYRELDRLFPNDEQMEIPSEAWLARVERGQNLPVDRRVIDILCQVLDCTDEQRVKILALASGDIIGSQLEQPEEAAFINIMSELLYKDEAIRSQIRTLLRDRRTYTLSQGDILEILVEVLQLTVSKRRNSRLRIPQLQPISEGIFTKGEATDDMRERLFQANAQLEVSRLQERANRQETLPNAEVFFAASTKEAERLSLRASRTSIDTTTFIELARLEMERRMSDE